MHFIETEKFELGSQQTLHLCSRESATNHGLKPRLHEQILGGNFYLLV